MATPFQHILQSERLTFYIGQERKSVSAHAAAIASLSRPLYVLIYGSMSEAQTKCVDIPYIEFDDFARFCEFAYKGDYMSPSWSYDEESSQQHDSFSSPSSPFAEVRYYGPPIAVPDTNSLACLAANRTLGDHSREANMRPSLLEQVYDHNLRTSNPDRTLQFVTKMASVTPFSATAINLHAYQDFTEVFLSHSRLYAFARLYLIESLKAKTLLKLHQTLIRFRLYSRRLKDVLQLVRYIYSNDYIPDRTAEGTIDDMRGLVVEYICCDIGVFSESSLFMELLEEGGEFVGDLWTVARQLMA
ncbi:hypothetical protein EJ04DRAFT_3131 [Polyplosphaeria fusca]|uniref:BTB domain-containing protein n=1 Tax=Polyplosphaeria fusca TaxID=682080 RepID=A0A9P4R9B6_9PLEO|nr:hypothetical protein EJ04DRAFT_3131 [Polyplosphaeria fusca]